VTAPLVNQPSVNPTRKWTAARIAELTVTVLAAAVLIVPDLDLSVEDMEKIAGGVGLLVTVAGAVAGWVTRNRATTEVVVVVDPPPIT
jgi:hypothetical protein